LANSLLFLGSIYLKKYQELPAQLGMVLVSLFPFFPATSIFTHSVFLARGAEASAAGS
jgi:hypothetical protein